MHVVLSFLRQLATGHCSQLLLSAGRAAIDRYLLPAGHAAANLPHAAAAVARWDRRTDRQMDGHRTVPSSVSECRKKHLPYRYFILLLRPRSTLQCFDAVGWAACRKTEWWGAGLVVCLERDADLYMAQLMPLPLTVSCFSKIQIGSAFLVPAYPGSPGQRAVKRVCVCVCVLRPR